MIGEILSELWKDKGLKQKQLAEKLFINFRTYGGYERNEIEINDELKIKIAKYFNVSVDYLLGLSKNPQPVQDENEYIRLPGSFSTKS